MGCECFASRFHVCLLLLILTGTLAQGFLFGPPPSCEAGWFNSPRCQYKCHCTDNACDAKGECTGNAKCEKGWFGPACQYEDLAANHFKPSAPSWVNDGDDDTCNEAENLQTVTVTLSQPFPLTWLRIHTKVSGAMNNISLKFRGKSSNIVLGCDGMSKAEVDGHTVDVHCHLQMAIQQVILTGDGVKSLCSVYISGGRNVALKQRTTQSSTYTPPSSAMTSESSLAVDGDRNGDWHEGSCTHTDGKMDASPTWEVILSRPQILQRYVLYNRVDGDDNNCCKDRLKGFILTSYAEDESEIFQYEDEMEMSHDSYMISPIAMTTPVSRVTVAATNTLGAPNPVLSLCEVELYGDTVCPHGKYGRDCENMCNCATESDTMCFVSTGGCPSGCAAGYHGESCDQEMMMTDKPTTQSIATPTMNPETGDTTPNHAGVTTTKSPAGSEMTTRSNDLTPTMDGNSENTEQTGAAKPTEPGNAVTSAPTQKPSEIQSTSAVKNPVTAAPTKKPAATSSTSEGDGNDAAPYLNYHTSIKLALSLWLTYLFFY